MPSYTNAFGPPPTRPASTSAADIVAFAQARNTYAEQQKALGGTGQTGGQGSTYSGNPGDYQGFYSDPDWFTRNAPNKVFAGQTLSNEYQQGMGQQGLAGQMYQQALANPTAAADQYGKYFQQAADAYTKPAMQQFNQDLARTQGATAARFGGNASSEEGRNVYNTSNLFSQNLTNALAGLAPQQVSAGQQYAAQLGNAYALQSQNQMALRNAILSGLSPGANTPYVDPGASIGGSILGAVGGVVGGLTGGPAGAAAGSSLGSSLVSQAGTPYSGYGGSYGGSSSYIGLQPQVVPSVGG